MATAAMDLRKPANYKGQDGSSENRRHRWTAERRKAETSVADESVFVAGAVTPRSAESLAVLKNVGPLATLFPLADSELDAKLRDACGVGRYRVAVAYFSPGLLSGARQHEMQFS